MAGKGGGSWKVAYADFVTAMMAFFLVMWICAQDKAVKAAVANYFNDPLGSSSRPKDMGAFFQSLNNGSVPATESVAGGTGRKSFSRPTAAGYATKRVSDWVHQDEQRLEYWQTQARQHLESAARRPRVPNENRTDREVASQRLAQQLKSEVAQGIPSRVEGLYGDLLSEVLVEVNWTELAEDLVRSP